MTVFFLKGILKRLKWKRRKRYTISIQCSMSGESTLLSSSYSFHSGFYNVCSKITFFSLLVSAPHFLFIINCTVTGMIQTVTARRKIMWHMSLIILTITS